MKHFMELYAGLDETNSTNQKIKLLTEYFTKAPKSDSAWLVYFLSGQRFKRIISYRKLVKWVQEEVNYPKWMFSEIWETVGDTAEAISLSLDTSRPSNFTIDQDGKWSEVTLTQWIDRISKFEEYNDDRKRQKLVQWWSVLPKDGIFLLIKLLTGGFRVGVSKLNTAKALAKCYDIPQTTILHRLSGKWTPSEIFYDSLVSTETQDTDESRPYPFFLASQLDVEVEDLGEIDDWSIEWKWDGIRSQLIKRNDSVYLWSRGNELINSSFPELISASENLPNGIVIDAEIIAYYNNEPLSFSVLQRRIGRENVTKEILEDAPVVIMAYDLMEWKGEDIRSRNHEYRRKLLEELYTSGNIDSSFMLLSPILKVESWKSSKVLREKSRENRAEGFILKKKDSEYKSGRKRGDWWKWKIDPLSVDVILMYAQAGSGRRASLFTDYTFGVWDENHELVPIGKSYRGLTDEEMKKLDKWIRSNTVLKQGAFREVKPEQVFELGFDGVISNPRTKSGLSLRFSRIMRWRKDKPASEADTIESVREFLKYEGTTEVRRYHQLDEFFN
ncbi:MAG: ATP-dependent DNA ligase [Candidatus Kariarchaeaceae archaeon]|jgi:DNA ligase-1